MNQQQNIMTKAEAIIMDFDEHGIKELYTLTDGLMLTLFVSYGQRQRGIIKLLYLHLHLLLMENQHFDVQPYLL